ncbi:MAG TPA: M20/M25/M40 family metallo-hydrolase [Micropepsaceae bacterium]|nr:M20/M25/M40 family metallo-hydrolase [Micropepsaceae bacterium]
MKEAIIRTTLKFAAGSFLLLLQTSAMGQPAGAPQPGNPAAAPPSAAALIGRLDFEKYKATIKNLTQFGDRRQGTDRNRAAIDWIETQLKSYGCPTERLKYEYLEPGRTGSEPRVEVASPANGAEPARTLGGGRDRYLRNPTFLNGDPNRQPDPKLRALDMPAAVPGPREEVYCTKIGTTHPEEMYIVSAHMDGHGWGEAANDDGSGTALVMELARILNSPDVVTDRSIRFILWNNEETGHQGSRAYVAQRRALQGKEMPAGSGKYPEPKWLGMIQHDMMLFDHGAPRSDGSISPEQRPEADINIEFQSASKFAAEANTLAWAIEAANERYATEYPAVIGSHMTNTDSVDFQDAVASVSLRENERGTQIGSGWDPHWHQPTDVFATFSDKDFRLGLNAAQTTLGAVAQLAGARLKK